MKEGAQRFGQCAPPIVRRMAWVSDCMKTYVEYADVKGSRWIMWTWGKAGVCCLLSFCWWVVAKCWYGGRCTEVQCRAEVFWWLLEPSWCASAGLMLEGGCGNIQFHSLQTDKNFCTWNANWCQWHQQCHSLGTTRRCTGLLARGGLMRMRWKERLAFSYVAARKTIKWSTSHP